MPLVSVALAFHQVVPFLRPAVRSILQQTLSDLELIVVDNGTGAGLSALGEEGGDPRVRLISFPTNRGVAAAYNAARAAARGEFVANMDYDDVALPERLERQVAALRAEPGLGLLSTHARVIDETGAVRGSQFTLATHRDSHLYAAYSMPITNPTVMARREIFAAFPLREEFSTASDMDLFARVSEHYPCRALPEPLLHYRRHALQTTEARKSVMVLNACMIRLVTARRRAGRPERLAELFSEMATWRAEPPAAAVIYGHFAHRARDEGFPLLAVFLARRRVSVQRTLPALVAATTVLAQACRAAPAQAGQLVRMYATGPLRTHNLRPV